MKLELISPALIFVMGFLSGSDDKWLPAMQKTRVQSLGWEDPLEKEMAIQYYCLENPMDREA